MKEAVRGYIAGFWEGEGSACIWKSSRSGNLHGRIHLTQKSVVPLTFIQAKLEYGRIYHRRDNGLNRLVIAKQADVRKFIRLIYPHVQNPDKRERLRDVYRVAGKGG